MNSTLLPAPSFAGVSNSVGSQFTLQWYLDRSLRGSRMLSLLLLLAFSFTPRLLSAAEVATDKTDYPPGSTVQITGGGFQAEELVQCQVVHSDGLAGGSGHEPWMVTANASGDVATSWFVAPDDSVGATLLLTATGQASGLVAMATFTDAGSFGPGTAPVIFPAGGFAIDGDLVGYVPPDGIGDWVPHTPGAGGSVLTSAGVPLNSANTFHLKDLYDADEDNFAGGLKYFDDPTIWTWVNTNKAPAKNDINHGLLHFSTDAGGNIWLAVASDRFSEKGDAYIDFEFLQNSLTMTGTDGGAKGFASAGPNGGRTVGDFLLTLSLTQGGSVAGFKVEIWEPDTGVPLGYTYHDRTALVPAGSVYAAVNTASVPVSFGAFGGFAYDVNTFVEGAVNLTALLGKINPCTSLGVKTVLIKCKTSQADTATITDFIAPLQIDKRIGIADAGSDEAKCSEGASTSFALAGVVTVPSPDVVSSTTWSVVSGIATIASPGNLDSTVSVSSPTATLRLTVVTSPNNCMVTDDVVLTVKPVPDCTITGPDGPLCPNLSGNQYSGVAGLSSYAWSITGNGSIVGDSNAQTVSVTAGAGCASAFTLTLAVTNDNGCSNTCTKTVNVEDIAPPVIEALPDPSTVNCPATPVFAVATATDDCGSAFTLTSTDATTPAACAGQYRVTRTWTATDACGNSSTASQTINVQDNTAPVIAALPAPSTINCPATPVFAEATAVDACGSAFTLTFDDVPTPGDCAGEYSVIRTWTATDACGNSSTASQTINVIDTDAPVIAALPALTTIDCPATPNFEQATATDRCDKEVALTFEDVTTPGSCPGNYSVTRTWTATDDCGNSSTASQTINVQDITAPVIDPLSALTTINCSATPVFAQATATDLCDKDVKLTFEDVTTAGNCPGNYSVTRTWMATDNCGNSSTASQMINVQDVTAPVIGILPNLTTINCSATPVFAQATATDTCGQKVALTFDDVTTPGNCPGNYSVTRTWTATDECGNSSTASQTINVQDLTAPVIDPLPGPSAIDCPATPSFAQATATDLCGQKVALTFVDAPTTGSCPGGYSVTRTWTATDDCGNSSTASQTINVQDLTAPVIDPLPGPSAIDCPATPVFAQATATDLCDKDVKLTFVDAPTTGNCPGGYSVTRTWTATDDCGNSSTASQTINVQDITAPVIDPLSALTTISCSATPVFAQATATDLCDKDVKLTFEDVTTPGGCPGNYSVTRTWTATDDCGNSSTASQTINVQDITAPVIGNLPGLTTINCSATLVFAPATATDLCDQKVALTFKDVITPGSCLGNYIVIRTWTATDDCGNSSTASQTVNVQDNTPPVIICPRTISVPYPNVPAPATTVEELVGLGGSAIDACSTVTISSSDSAPTGACPAVITRTYTAVDECGNASACEQKINQFCPSLVTNSELCTFGVVSNCDGDAFRLNFQQRMDNPSLWKIVSTNPGQFYYNIFVNGTPGDEVNATATIPYPFVTHGAQPVHVYSDYTVTGSEEAGYCLVPGTGLSGFTITTAGGQSSTSGAAIITLADYTSATSTTTVTVSGGKIPESGTICVTIHLDYGLKKTDGWSAGSTGAIDTGSLGVTLSPCQMYVFSFTGGVVDDTRVVYSVNSFKKNPGFGVSIVLSPDLGSAPVQGVKFEAWNSTGITKIGQAFTGADGCGLIPYKHKAKPEEYWIKVPAYQKAIKVTVKANGFGFGEFEVP